MGNKLNREHRLGEEVRKTTSSKSKKNEKKNKRLQSAYVDTRQDENVDGDQRRDTMPRDWKSRTPNIYVNVGSAPTLPRPRTDNKQSNKVVRAMYDYQSRYPDDCSFKTGDKLVVTAGSSDDDWWLATNLRTQHKGYIPTNYVVIDDDRIESQDASKRNQAFQQFDHQEDGWWYAVDKSCAIKQLMMPGNSTGTFLIRNSAVNGAYALSVLDRDNEKDQLIVRHFLIRKMDDGSSVYISPKSTFKSLQKLVTYYSETGNRGLTGMPVILTRPCPREVLPIPFKELEVKPSDIVLGSRLGAGQFGEVYAGKFRNVVDVAVKTLKVGSMAPEAFIDEAKIMHQLRHRRLVQLLGVCSDPMYIITELMANGSLLDYLKKDAKRTVKYPTLVDMAAQVADGMSYLESKNFIHRDLRAANILAGDNFIVKVADFGLARMLDAIYDGVYTTGPETKFPIRWTAPEAFSSQDEGVGAFSVKSDVWSFGILLYEMVTYGGNPYPGLTNFAVKTQTMRGYRMPNPDGSNLHSGGERCECSTWMYDLMLGCWQAEPEKRPTFESLKHLLDDYPVSSEGSYAEQMS